MKFGVILPSRNRTKNFAKSINMMIASCAQPENLFFYIVIDDDDPQKQLYQQMINDKPNMFLCLAYPNQKGRYVNDMADKAYNDGCDALICHADDIFYHQDTAQHWDMMLRQRIMQIPDKICLCWFDDGFQGHRLATHPIITRQWYEVLNYFFPEIFYHFFADTWIDDIARKIQRAIYIPEIKIQHQHFLNQQHKYDHTYRKNNRWFTFDQFTYNTHAQLREEHAQMLRNRIKEFTINP